MYSFNINIKLYIKYTKINLKLIFYYYNMFKAIKL